MQNAPPLGEAPLPEGSVPGAPTADSPSANLPVAANLRPPLVRQSRGAQLLSLFPAWIWIAFAGLFGGIVGLGGFTFNYASGLSYLSNDPAACVNCHIMREEFDGWNRGPHHAVATCNDCHTPHDSILSKYAIKALNGFRHSYAFTTGNFPEPIRITPMDEDIARTACLSCHGALTNDMNHANTAEPTDCLRCHKGVGHVK